MSLLGFCLRIFGKVWKLFKFHLCYLLQLPDVLAALGQVLVCFIKMILKIITENYTIYREQSTKLCEIIIWLHREVTE
jgi:hypothetical protein